MTDWVDTDVRPFEAEVFLRRAANSRSRALAIVITGLAILGSLIAVTAASGDLRIDSWWSTISGDWLHLVGLSDGANSEPDFPLGRDFVSIFTLGLQLANLYVIVRQWEHLGSMGENLQRNGVLIFKPAGTREANEIFDRCRKKIARISQRGLLVGAVALVAALLLHNRVTADSVFLDLAPDGLIGEQKQQWSTEAYEAWWASTANVAGHYLFVGVSTVVIYFLILQNYVGHQITMAYYRSRNLFDLSANEFCVDGMHGWSPLTSLMRTVYVSLTLNAMTMATFFIVLQGRKVGGLLPLLFLFFAGVGVFLYTPFYLLNRGLADYRQRRTEELLGTYNQALSSADSIDRLLLRDHLRREVRALESATRFQYRRPILGFIFVNLIPVAVGLFEVSSALFSS